MSQKANEPHLTGLTDQEVLSSREKYGVNLLTPPKRPSMWKLYLEKFQDPVIRVLLVAAVFSLIISIIENEYAETIGIFFAIFLATGIGFYFEYDANKKFDLLNAARDSPQGCRGRRYCYSKYRRRSASRRYLAGSRIASGE